MKSDFSSVMIKSEMSVFAEVRWKMFKVTLVSQREVSAQSNS